jgi:hypothetical protein
MSIVLKQLAVCATAASACDYSAAILAPSSLCKAAACLDDCSITTQSDVGAISFVVLVTF